MSYNQDKLTEVLEGDSSIAAQKLKELLSVPNVIIGDAMANMLLLEGIMYDLDMSIQQLDEIYTDNPSKVFRAPLQQNKSKFVLN